MINSIFYILLGCLLLSQSLQAQEIRLEGKVVDAEKHRVIPDVSVSVMQKDSLFIDFTMSGQDGIFSLQTNADSVCYLCFSCIGYHRRILPMRYFRQGQEIELIPQVFKIKEVEVTSRRLVQKGDTLVYQVSGFKLPQDRSIGDVLKKMPGLEVLPGGQVKYQGKAISKLYIEGADLLESKYGVAVQNLRAKDVEAVEVMEHHEAVKALKSTRFNEAAALNLKLKESAKSHLVGVGDLGAGTGHSPVIWDNRLMGMNFSRKSQNLSVFKNNNTGVDLTKELKPLTFDPFAASDQTHESGLLSSTAPGSPDLPGDRYLQNSSHLLSVNQLWKSKEERQWRLQLSYINNRISGEGDRTVSYILSPVNILQIQESTCMKAKEHQIEGELSYEWNTDACFLKNQLSFNNRFDSQQTVIDNKPGERKLNLRSPHHTIGNRFSLIRNYGSNVFQVYSFNQFSSLPQQLSVRPGQPDTLFTGLAYDALSQKAEINTFVSSTFTSFRLRVFNFYIGTEAGLRLQNNHLGSDLSYSTDETFYMLPDSFINDLHYLRTLAYVEPNLSYKGMDNRLSASLRFTLGYEHERLKKMVGNQTEKASFFVFSPQLNVHFRITPLWEIGGDFIRDFQSNDIRGLYPGYVMTDYRTFQLFNPQLMPRHSNRYGFSTTFKNPMKGLFISLRGSLMHDFEPIIEQVGFDGIVRIGNRVPFKHTNTNKSLNLNGGQSFSFWNTRLKWDLSYDEMKYAYYMTGLSYYKTRSVSVSPGIVIQPFRFLNVEYKLFFLYSQLRMDQANVADPVRTVNHLLAFHYFPVKNWQIDFTHSFYRNNRPEQPNCYFMDLAIAYRFRNDSELRLMATNLLNARRYEIETVGSYSTYLLSYPLRGREICLKYSFFF